MSNATEQTLAGMWCHICFADEPDEKLYRYLSFQEETIDELAIPDEQTFYYLSQKEVTELLASVRDGDTKFYVDNEWFIVIPDGFVPEYYTKDVE